jgi:hypothetical protein
MSTLTDLSISGSLTLSGSFNISGSNNTLTGSFTGDGSGLSGVTGSWDGLFSGSAIMTGSVNLTGSMTATSFSGDGSGLTGVTAEFDGSHTGSALFSGSFEVDGIISQVNLGCSTFIGANAGSSDDKSNNRNTAVGHNALNASTTGVSNVAIGVDALKTSTTGGGNIAIGHEAFKLGTTSNNVAIGFQALIADTSGTCNTAVGSKVMNANVSGDNNTSVGESALASLTVGDGNTALGSNAGKVVSGSVANSCNVFIGFNSGPVTGFPTNKKLYIDITGSNNPFIFGDFETRQLTINSQVSASIFSGSFVGDGSNLTGVTGEWDGSHNGDANITGSFTVSGSAASIDFTNTLAVSGSVFSGSYVGDGSGLTGVTGEWDGTRVGNTSITGSFAVSGSTTLTGTLNVSGDITAALSVPASKDITMTDSSKIIMDSDFKIYKGIDNHSHIEESGSGDLMIKSNNEVEIASGIMGEHFARFTKDAGVQLFHDNVKKLETTAGGLVITGSITGSSITVGSLTSGTNPAIHAKTSNTSENILLESTDTGAGSAPDLVLFRNAGAPSDNDTLGVIEYKANQIGGSNPFVYNGIYSRIIDASEQQSALTISAFYGSSTSHAIGIHNIADNTTSGAVIVNPTGFAQVPQHTLQVEGNTSISSSLVVSGSSIIFKNLPTSQPSVSGSLWLSGSNPATPKSQYLMVFNP